MTVVVVEEVPQCGKELPSIQRKDSQGNQIPITTTSTTRDGIIETENDKMIHRLEILEYDDPAYDAVVMSRLTSLQRARKRIGALFLTFSIELFVAFVVTRYTDTLKTFPLLVAFMPVISAVSGNVGLQSSTIVTRGIAVGLINPKEFSKALWSEVTCAFFLASSVSVCIGIISSLWKGNVLFGGIIALAQFLSIMTASVTGSLAPLVGKYLNFDPASFAGPMETAVQDVIGNSLFLVLSSVLLQNLSVA